MVVMAIATVTGVVIAMKKISALTHLIALRKLLSRLKLRRIAHYDQRVVAVTAVNDKTLKRR
jgi:hypothetical protein